MAVLLVALSGAGKLFFDVASRTFVQRLLPDHLLTAMFGLQESFTMIGIALGTLAAPALVGLVGAKGAFIAAGASCRWSRSRPTACCVAWTPGPPSRSTCWRC